MKIADVREVVAHYSNPCSHFWRFKQQAAQERCSRRIIGEDASPQVSWPKADQVRSKQLVQQAIRAQFILDVSVGSTTAFVIELLDLTISKTLSLNPAGL